MRAVLGGVLLMLLGGGAYAQWQNPADRYNDEYKKYLNIPIPVTTT